MDVYRTARHFSRNAGKSANHEPQKRIRCPFVVSYFNIFCRVECSLGNIILNELEYYRDHASPYFENFRDALNTIAGLGYTAILADCDSSLLSTYKHYFELFLLYRATTHQELTDTHTMALAQSVSHMIQLAFLAFRAIQFPNYFENFRTQITVLMEKLPLHGFSGHLEENAERIEKMLKQIPITD